MFYKAVKRGFDLCSSAAALVALAPVFAVVSVGIKLSSAGPILYKSERIGLGGKPFTMFKFRSMHVKQEGTVESKYIVNDARIFKFGSFLRKSKLDELPQLLNVFLADMSVVGPRPYPQFVVDRLYKGDYLSILDVKPGLACHDSLFDYAHGELFVTDEMKYENEIVPIRTELAKMYVDDHGIKTDILIIGRTIAMIWKIVVEKKTNFPYTALEKKAAFAVKARKAAQTVK